MNRLLKLNETGQFHAGPRQRGFVCTVPQTHSRPGGRQVTKRLKGITKLIARKYKRGSAPRTPARPGGRRGGMVIKRTLKLFTLPVGTVPLINTKRVGTAVHRHVMHHVVCLPRSDCQCKRVHGSATPALTRQLVSVKACVSSAQTFVRDYNLEPVGAEVIVHHHQLGVGTRIDALFRPRGAAKTNNGPIVLISWKSGVGPRDTVDFTRQRAQIELERQALVNTHGVNVVCGYIVYLTAARNMSTKQVAAYYHAERVF
jgi:hypothetical protein